jgi:hypothetical protein
MEPDEGEGVLCAVEQDDEKDAGDRASSPDMTQTPRPAPRSVDQDAAVDEARLRQQAIGVRLRQMFDEVVNEPIPDDFLAILRRADDKGPSGGPS